MSEAQDINSQLEAAHPALFRALSPLGRRAFFPPGIPFQAAEAKATRYNGTIGIFTDGHGQAVPLPSVARALDLSSDDRNRALLYSPVAGIMELRETWRRRQRRDQGDEPPSSLPLVTNGLSHGLSIAADLFTCEEHSVLIPEPFWGNYRQVFSLRTGTQIRTAPAYRGGRFNPLAISEAAAGLPPGNPVVAILNFPSNPGGYSPTPEERAELRRSLLAMADERPIVVLCDDAYAGFVFEQGIPSTSMFWELAGAHEQLIAVKIDGATKELSFFGGRVGFLTFALEAKSPAFEVMQNKVMSLVRSTIGSPPAVSQTILLQALREETLEEEIAHVFAIAEGRYRAIRAALAELDPELLAPLPFNSGFFVMLRLKDGLDLDVQEVRRHLIREHDTGIIATPPCYLRIATCSVAAEDLPEMIKRLARGVEELAARLHR